MNIFSSPPECFQQRYIFLFNKLNIVSIAKEIFVKKYFLLLFPTTFS